MENVLNKIRLICTKQNLLSPKAILFYFILLKLLICFFPVNYDYFRDELYYVAMSDRLDYGYVDVPPVAPFLLSIIRAVFGTSQYSLHILPAASGVLVLIIVYLIIKRLEGDTFSLVLALACTSLASIYVALENMYTYDHLDKLWWALLLYFVVCIIKTGNSRYWLYFGLTAGVALLSKITVGFLGVALLLGMLLTKQRIQFTRKELWLGGAMAVLIFSPYVVWQYTHGFPLLEYLTNYSMGKTYHSGLLEFIYMQILTLNPLSMVVWLPGLIYFFSHPKGREFRMLGVAYCVIFLICLVTSSKFYVLTPFYVVLFAGGSVYLSELIEKIRAAWLKPTAVLLIIVTGLLFVPFLRPVLPIETLSAITSNLNGDFGVKTENFKITTLPQHIADRFGWRELAEKVAGVYRSLPPDEREKACVFTVNYGEAGALWLYGARYQLPKPLSGHLQYYVWGMGQCSGEVVIVVGIRDYRTLKRYFRDVYEADRTDNNYAMPFEQEMPIMVCKNPYVPLKEKWHEFKIYF
jgi:hypothetical protein